MKLTMKTAIGTSVVVALLMGTTDAHPGLSASKKQAPCPLLQGQSNQEAQRRQLGEGMMMTPVRSLSERTGDGGVPKEGFKAVMDDLKVLLTDSQDSWPGDFNGTAFGPHYGGLFIRLAWHCSGSYRESDGRGGCDGGRIRFPPELTWMDNGNLDKALDLLKPIKVKYGPDLSWGDLVILSGTAAIEGMGGKILGFCGGRIDDANGDDSLKLGPSDEQEEIGPCQSLNLQGQCLTVNGTALGPTTVGLIYVDPAGPVGGVGDPVASAADIATAFARMGFNDRETVALVGGGHAFGKAHGACPEPPCGDGMGENTYTSGFEGAWTTAPTVWTNQYFTNLFDFTWNQITGPGGMVQFEPVNTADGSAGPDIFMLTSDLAMKEEPYLPITTEYAGNIATLETDFAAAWYRLTSADMGPANRCFGDMVPEPQEFQFTLPESPKTLPDYIPVRSRIQTLITEDPTKADDFINLAFRCASTYRQTDYRGGCNGAKIRFAPESEWETNAGTEETLALVEPLKEEFVDVTYADMIVLGGITALEHENSDLDLPFCGGYVDAEDAAGSEVLAPRIYSTPLITVSDDFIVKGLTPEEGVALASRENVGSQYYTDLIAAGAEGGGEFDEYELALLEDEFRPIVEIYASDEAQLKATFATAWVKMMTADRYGDFRENACTGVDTPTEAGDSTPKPTVSPTDAPTDSPVADPTDAPTDSPSSARAISIVAGAIVCVFAILL